MSSGTVANVPIQLVKGTKVSIRVHDPHGLLKTGPSNPKPSDVQIAISSPRGMFHVVPIETADDHGRIQSIVVPINTPFRVEIFSATARLTGKDGNNVPDKGLSIPFQVSDGQAQPPIEITIAGLKK